MRRNLSLALFPALGTLFFALAIWWFGPAAQVAWREPIQSGRVEGMMLIRATTADVLSHMDTQLNLARVDGARFEVAFENGHAIRVSALKPDGSSMDIPSGVLSDPPEAEHPLVSSYLAGQILDLMRGNATIIERRLRRERRRNSPDSIVSVEKIERATARLNLTRPPTAFFADASGIHPQLANETPAVEIVTRAFFQLGAQKSPDARKSPALKEFSETIDGRPVESGKKDFLLQRETWRTEFRALVKVQNDTGTLAVVADIGRRGQPANGLALFDSCHVQFPGTDVKSASVTGVPPPPGPRLPHLEWFSLECEAIFSRWAYPIMLVLIGTAFWIAGIILISLALFPSRCRMDLAAGSGISSQPKETSSD